MTILVILLLSGVAHEAGHALCARAHGLTVRVFFKPPVAVGIATAPETAEQSRSIASAGPLVSILFGLVVLATGQTAAGWACVTLGLLNLIPCRRFDGWHILHPKGAP